MWLRRKRPSEPLCERVCTKPEVLEARANAERHLEHAIAQHERIKEVGTDLRTRVMERNHIREAIRYVIQEKTP